MASKNDSKGTAVAKASPSALSTQDNSAGAALPAFMQGEEKQGKDSYDASDLIIPRVALSQGISPQVMDGRCDNGHFWHTINEEDLGDELEVVPLLHRKQWTLWRPLHEGGGVIARASDGRTWDADFDVEVAPYKEMPKKKVRYAAKKGDVVSREVGLGRWGSMDPDNEDSGPAATLSHIFLFRAPRRMDLGPFIVFLQKSSEQVAKQLLTKIQLSVAPTIFGQVYLMKPKGAQNNAGQEYNQYAFTANGFVGDETLYREFQKEHELYKGSSFRTNDDDAQEDGGPASDGKAPADTKDDSY